VKWITFAALVVISIGWELPVTQAAVPPSGPEMMEQHTTTSKTSIDTSVSQPPPGKAESLQQRPTSLIADEVRSARNIEGAGKVNEHTVTRLHPRPLPPQGPKGLKQKA
jgi:hypothetical protein